MTAERSARGSVPWVVRAYIVGVGIVALLAFAVAWSSGSVPQWTTMVAIFGLTLPLWWVGETRVSDNVTISLANVVLLAAAVIVGPLGAGLVGLLVIGLTRERLPGWARVFNMAMTGLLGVVGGAVYLAAGGRPDPSALTGPGPLVRELALPLLAADLAQAVLNVVLIGGIMRMSAGVPVRLQAARLLASGPVYVGYGVLGFLLLLLWFPAGLGPLSVLLLLAPLLGGHWAYVQYAAQSRVQEQSLDVLVAALEHKLPELTGHSTRVAELAGRTAEHLGLGVIEVGDVRRAAMLHDLGRLAHPANGDPAGRAGAADRDDHMDGGDPATAARMVDGLTFLAGASDILRQLSLREGRPDGAQVVDAAAFFDLSTAVGVPGRSAGDAVAELRASGLASDRVVDALAWTVHRTTTGEGR